MSEDVREWRLLWASGQFDDYAGRGNGFLEAGIVWSVALADVAGRPCVVAGRREAVQVWDLETGREIGGKLTGHTGDVITVATTVLDGRPIAVSGGRDLSLRMWDLEAGEASGEPLTPAPGHQPEIHASAVVTRDGRPHLVTGGTDGFGRIWDLTKRQEVGPLLDPDFPGRLGGVLAVAVADLDGAGLVVTGGHPNALAWDRWPKTLRVWDLETGAKVGDAITGHHGGVFALATTTLGRRTVVVSSGEDGNVHVRDLKTRKRVGRVLAGHAGEVCALTTMTLDGRTVAVSGGEDGTLRVWDLAAGRQLGAEAVFPAPVNAVAAAPGERLVVGVGREVAVLGRG